MQPHPLNNFETQKYYQIKDGAYVINLDKYKSMGNHWITLYVNGNNVAYFVSFGVEQIF